MQQRKRVGANFTIERRGDTLNVCYISIDEEDDVENGYIIITESSIHQH